MSQQASNKASLLKTVIYSSLFHFPLKADEIWRYLISDTPVPQHVVKKLLEQNIPHLSEKDSYYFLKGDEKSVLKRQQEEKNYAAKLALAQKAGKLLSFIPSILFIGISGSLAVGSAPTDADIDFFIITSDHTVWSTRLLSLFLLSLVGLRRKRGSEKAPDKICLNLFLSVSQMKFFTASPDIYTAHELAQLYPLVNRKKTYEHLLDENKWYRDFLPNAAPRSNLSVLTTEARVGERILQLMDPLCAFLQRSYMKHHQTTETIEKELMLLHPNDYKQEILLSFERKLTKYGH